MNTKKISKKTSAKKSTSKTHVQKEQVMEPKSTKRLSAKVEVAQDDATPTTPTPTPEPTTTTPAPSNGASIIYVPQPPTDANIPSPPAGFVPTLGSDYRGITPKKAHMAALPDVINELTKSTDFDSVFGKTAPPYQYTLQMFSAAAGWSGQRAKMRAWDLYCRTQAGLAWRETHALMARIGPAFTLAATTDSTVAGRYPGMARLFGVSKQIAKKGAVSRKANKQLVAAGKEPLKGAIGKKRQKQTEKALLAASLAQQQGAHGETGAPVAQPAAPGVAPGGTSVSQAPSPAVDASQAAAPATPVTASPPPAASTSAPSAPVAALSSASSATPATAPVADAQVPPATGGGVVAAASPAVNGAGH